jgi:hypothetical protein
MNIILIDFAFTSDDKLRRICDELKLNYEVLLKDKKEFKIHRTWIDVTSKTMIAYSIISKPDEIIYTPGYDSIFRSLPRYEPKPIELPAPKVDLNVDSILDKISKYGIDSLLKEERDFLDNSSKDE